jgi:hypothetical protein
MPFGSKATCNEFLPKKQTHKDMLIRYWQYISYQNAWYTQNMHTSVHAHMWTHMIIDRPPCKKYFVMLPSC